MTERWTEPSEPNQKQIDAGAAALLKLDPGVQDLALATAKQLCKDAGESDWRVFVPDACKLVYRVARREYVRRYQMMGRQQMNARQLVIVDAKWQNLQYARVLLHPDCAEKVAKFYGMKPAEKEARYRPFTGEVRPDDKCDLCRKSISWALADHMKEVGR